MLKSRLPKTKVCSYCKEEKPLNCFNIYRDTRNVSGEHIRVCSRCKACKTKIARERYSSDTDYKERRLSATRKYLSKPEKAERYKERKREYNYTRYHTDEEYRLAKLDRDLTRYWRKTHE